MMELMLIMRSWGLFLKRGRGMEKMKISDKFKDLIDEKSAAECVEEVIVEAE